MSLKAKIEAVIYASEEPVTLQQLVTTLGEEAAAELDGMAAEQELLPLEAASDVAGTAEAGERALDEVPAAEPHENHQSTESEPLADEHSDAANSVSDAGETVPADAQNAGPAASVEAVAAPMAGEAEADKRRLRERERAVRDHIRRAIDGLMRDYANGDRGIEIREVASGYRMATKPEYHDAVRSFVKSLKPALKLTLPALETLAVVAYKQPVTAAELSEIRGVDSSGVLGGLLARKLIATAGRKQVIGRPMLYKTTRDFLLRFGLKDVNELPSMDEFERLASELVEGEDLPEKQGDARPDEAATLIEQANVRGDAEHIREVTGADASVDADETGDTDESDEALAAEAAADASTETDRNATAETAAGGNDGRSNEPAAAAPLHTTQTGEPAPEHGPDQASESAGGQATTGVEEGERGRQA